MTEAGLEGRRHPHRRVLTQLRHAAAALEEAKVIALEEGLPWALPLTWLEQSVGGAIDKLEDDIDAG